MDPIFLLQIGEKSIDGSHEEAMFGAGGSIPETSSLATVTETKPTPQPVTSQAADKEGLFASWVR